MTIIEIEEKYVRHGWPSLDRPDLQAPKGWSLDLITGVNRIYNPKLSPDGAQIAFIWKREGLSDIYRLAIGSAGHWPERLTFNRKSKPYWWDETPQWSPDGRWLAFSLDAHVHVLDPETGPPVKVTGFTAGASSPVWMPDGKGLIVTIELEQALKLLLTDRDGRRARLLTHDEGDDLDARPAPDGKKIAYVHAPADDPNRLDLRLLDLETGEYQQLTGSPRQKDWSPRWSPDGEWIAFISQRSGNNDIWLMRPNGENLHPLSQQNLDCANLAWSPDGSRLACTINRGGSFDLALVEVESGKFIDIEPGRPIDQAGGQGIYSHLDWSPEGDFITAAYENPRQPPDLFQIDVSSGQKKQITFSNPPALQALPLVTPEEIRFTSYDGLEIPALLYRPAKSNQAGLIYPHGGPTDQYGYTWDIFAQYLVAKGYTFLAPNYRGSTGYGVAYEQANYNNWGLGDTQDVLYSANVLAGLQDIDRNRIGILGSSYGGYMVACCLSRDDQYRFACGVCKFGDAHLYSSWAQCERRTRNYTEMQIGNPASNRQVYLDGSPIYQAADIRKPVLILHGLDDDVVPPQSSEEWVEALQREGKVFEYKTYAGEPHGFQQRTNEIDVYLRIERFLDWYLMPHKPE